MQHKSIGLIIALMLFCTTMRSQTVPEDVQIANYVNRYHAKSQPELSGMYVIKQVATTGLKVKPGHEVTVHYEGRFLDNKIFDSSYQRNQPLTFVLGAGKVIPGWEQGIASLRQGEKAILIIPSYLAYGNKKTGSIPANTPLVFNIEVVKAGK
jgi:FKBP-type peptidyl-prolyl cis-trans isomerase